MIQALWIITETGQCIFSHKYVKMEIEDQLISGLLTAFNAFSSESGIGGVQQIGGEDNQFVYGSTGKLLVAALADKRDNPTLVEGLMDKISLKFEEKYAMYLGDEMYVDLNVFNGFENDIDEILLPKIHNRGIWSTIFGTFVTLSLVIGTLLLTIQIPQIPNLPAGLADNIAFLIFVASIPGMFIGALTAGTRKFAIIALMIGMLPVIIYSAYIIIINPEFEPARDIPIIILMTEQFIAIALLCGLLGGGIIERKRLFPFKKDIERIGTDKKDIPYQEPQQEMQEQYQQQAQTNDDFYSQNSFTEQEQEQSLPPPPPQDWDNY